MSAPNPIPQETPQGQTQAGWHNPLRHGNWAQWVAILVALTIPFILKACDRASSHEAEDFGFRVDQRIDNKLNPAEERIKGHIDKTLEPINGQLQTLNTQVSELKGRFDQLDTDQKKTALRVNQNEAIARLKDDPEKTLDAIRAEITLATATKKEIPDPKLADFKVAVRVLPQSASDYWKTVAAIINYESFIDQLSGQAPDPAMVSRPCGEVTNGINGNIVTNNTWEGSTFSHCIVDLDTNTFRDVVFKESVIRYQGGPTTLSNVKFINCRFLIEIRGSAPASIPENHLLLALLDSPSLRKIQLR